MEVHEIQLPPPKYWQQFLEDLCLGLFVLRGNDPTAQGRMGGRASRKAGTDISGEIETDRRVVARGSVQGKGQQVLRRSTVTEKELREEVRKKAKIFKPAPKH